MALLGGTAEAQSFRGGFDGGYRNGVRSEMNFRHRDFRDVRAGHRWSRGDRLSHRYGRWSAVNDWNRYGLRRPPRGYHWVRHNNDFLLAALATGLIADIMINANRGYAGGYGGYGYGY